MQYQTVCSRYTIVPVYILTGSPLFIAMVYGGQYNVPSHVVPWFMFALSGLSAAYAGGTAEERMQVKLSEQKVGLRKGSRRLMRAQLAAAASTFAVLAGGSMVLDKLVYSHTPKATASTTSGATLSAPAATAPIARYR